MGGFPYAATTIFGEAYAMDKVFRFLATALLAAALWVAGAGSVQATVLADGPTVCWTNCGMPDPNTK